MKQLLGHLGIVFKMRMLTGCFPFRATNKGLVTGSGFTLSPTHRSLPVISRDLALTIDALNATCHDLASSTVLQTLEAFQLLSYQYHVPVDDLSTTSCAKVAR